MSIPEILLKIKSINKTQKGKDFLSILLVGIVSIGSFGAGRMSKLDNKNEIIAIHGAKVAPQTSNEFTKTVSGQNFKNAQGGDAEKDAFLNDYTNGNYLASKRGKKYYPVDCPAAQNIKPENRLYFNTAAEAENRGYSLSTSCN